MGFLRITGFVPLFAGSKAMRSPIRPHRAGRIRRHFANISELLHDICQAQEQVGLLRAKSKRSKSNRGLANN